MGKRSDYKKRPLDNYPTPLEAVKPLVAHLPESFTFVEPCAGDGRLITHIETLIPACECVAAYDLEPRGEDIEELDARDLELSDLEDADYIITNPPWTRTKASGFILHELIDRFSNLKPTWLLFDADWKYTLQSSELMKRCEKVVAVGRVKWIENSPSTGKDNCAWYLFGPNQVKTEFYGR